jgi:hypothetical protein
VRSTKTQNDSFQAIIRSSQRLQKIAFSEREDNFFFILAREKINEKQANSKVKPQINELKASHHFVIQFIFISMVVLYILRKNCTPPVPY